MASYGQEIGIAIVVQFLDTVGMRRQTARRRKKHHVIVSGATHLPDRNQAVAAGPVFHDDRLVPELLQPVGSKPRADISTTAWRQRDHKLDAARGPLLGLRAHRKSVWAKYQSSENREMDCMPFYSMCKHDLGLSSLRLR